MSCFLPRTVWCCGVGKQRNWPDFRVSKTCCLETGGSLLRGDCLLRGRARCVDWEAQAIIGTVHCPGLSLEVWEGLLTEVMPEQGLGEDEPHWNQIRAPGCTQGRIGHQVEGGMVDTCS
jgi:hypothetical protein